MGLRLKRNTGTVAHLAPQEFCVDGDTTHLCCPLCSAVVRLDERHTVDAAGRVTPTFACPACPFLDWIELEPEET